MRLIRLQRVSKAVVMVPAVAVVAVPIACYVGFAMWSFVVLMAAGKVADEWSDPRWRDKPEVET